MPQDITNVNDVPMMAIACDLDRDDVKVVMSLIKLLASKNQGNIDHNIQFAIDTITDTLDNAPRIINDG